jgi:hypothetical protein
VSSASSSALGSASSRHPRITVAEHVMEPLRAICLRLLEAVEAEAFGAPTFQVRTKNFAMVHQANGRTSVWCKAPPGAQRAYVTSEPDRSTAACIEADRVLPGRRRCRQPFE